MHAQTSPNHGPRRDGLVPSIVVIHYTAMKSAEAAIERLCDPRAEVSAHYVIGRKGAVTQLVAEERRAWHAGMGEWRGKRDINSRSIGIELDNDGSSPFSAPLMDSLEVLMQDILLRWAIPVQNVIGHADMAPGRKTDPGPRFDWARLQRCGVAVRPDINLSSELFNNDFDTVECEELLHRIGYTAEATCKDKLQAFRDRFLPISRGAPNGADRAMMLNYLNDY